MNYETRETRENKMLISNYLHRLILKTFRDFRVFRSDSNCSI